MASPLTAMLSGGAGGVDMSAGPATSGASGGSESEGAVFNFAPPPSAQQTESISKTVGLVIVAVVVLWLMNRK